MIYTFPSIYRIPTPALKNPPAMQGARVQFLGWEDLLEKGKATHASILAWRSPRTLYSPWSCKESDATFTSLSFFSTLYEGFPGGSVIKNLPDKQEKGV